MELPRRQFFRQIFTGLGAAAALPTLGERVWAANWRTIQAGGPSGPIRLDANENAYGPCPQAFAALEGSAEMANRYPKGEYGDLADAIAAKHAVSRDRVVLGCGSSENLRMAVNAFLGPGKVLIQADPTFEFVGGLAKKSGAEVASIPLTKNYAHDVDAMLARAMGASGLVYICNANNPTGTLTPRRDLEGLLAKLPPSFYVMIDEAYHHFVLSSADYTSFLDRPVENERLIVARTFSKIYGLAGIRVGYSVSSPDVAKRLSAQAAQYAISLPAARAALAAWNDWDTVRSGAARNANDRQEFYRQAKSRGVAWIESQTNFVMLHTGRPIEEVIAHFKSNNVLIGRPFPPYTDYARISLGTPPDMEQFWRVWDLMPARKLPA